MMSCRSVVDVLMEFVSDDLAPERHAAVEQRLSDCPSCLAYLESYRLTIELARKFTQQKLPQSLWTRFQAILEQES